MNDTRNVGRTVLGIVTTTGTTSRAAGTAIGHTARNGRLPEYFDVTVRAAQRLALHVAFALMQFLVMLCLLFSVFYVHILWPV